MKKRFAFVLLAGFVICPLCYIVYYFVIGADEQLHCQRKTFDALHNSVTCLACSPSGDFAVTGDTVGFLKIWDVKRLAFEKEIHAHSDHIRTVAFSPDGTTFVSGCVDHILKLWDRRTLTQKRSLRCKTGVDSLAFAPDGKALAIAEGMGNIEIWSPSEGDTLRPFGDIQGMIMASVFSPSGQFYAAGSYDGYLRIWDFATGDVLATTQIPGDQIWALAPSPDGQFLVSGHGDGMIRVWEFTTLKPVSSWGGHDGLVYALAFSVDGKLLVSGGSDNRLIVWNPTKRRALANCQPNQISSAKCLAFLPEGESMLVASGVGQLLRIDIMGADAVSCD